MERLQKYISRCGIASRRAAEQMILDGRVRVNGKLINEMGVQIDENRDRVMVNGRLIRPVQQLSYIMLNKPIEVVSSCKDPQGRTIVLDLIPNKFKVYPIGRLDYLTEGLLLLTNDGEFANQLMHPRFKIPKTYKVKTKGYLTDQMVEKLSKGILLEDGITLPAELVIEQRNKQHSKFLLTIREGRNRQIRRMCQAVGSPVLSLKRIQIGPIKLGDIKPGSFRHLDKEEIAKMRQFFK